MKLSARSIRFLQDALSYVTIAQGISEVDSQHPIRQHALLFCLKTIGTCIEKSANSSEINLQNRHQPDTLKFWKNLYYLKNTLVHHFHANMANGFQLHPSQIQPINLVHQQIGQLKFYLELVTTNGNTNVDLGGQRFKFFFKCHDLGETFRKVSPRDSRATIDQKTYLKSLYRGLDILDVINPTKPATEESVTALKNENITKYYAIQNLLECIATLCCPNELDGPVHFDQKTRNTLNALGASVDSSLRSLGLERNNVMHQSNEFSRVHEHLNHMHELKQILLDNSAALGMQSQQSSSNEQKSIGSSSRETGSSSQNTKKSYASMTADRKPNDKLLQKAKAKAKAEVEEKSENTQDKIEENPSPKNSKN